MNIDEIKEAIVPVLDRYGVTKSALFGSYVRNEQTENSDIDILIEMNPDLSLLDFIGLKLELEDMLGIN